MKVIIVSGFLGSGKTTFILQAIEHLYRKNLKFALIINEIGDIGIDNAHFKQVGCNVWEILGGCICCTSASGFRRAIEEIRHAFKIDYMLIEPSGIADPDQIGAVVSERLTVTDDLKVIALLDSERIDVILEAVYPLTLSTIHLAHAVLISKTDRATPEEIEKAADFAEKNNTRAEITTADLSIPLKKNILEALL
jgi:G3E family GTPase